MKKVLIILVVAVGLSLGLGFCHSASAQSSDGYKVQIVVEPKGESRYITIKMMCYAPEDAVVRYQINVIKSGESGTLDSFQSGTFRIQKGEEKWLAKLAIDSMSEDQYDIMFSLLKDNKMVAFNRLCYPDDCADKIKI